MREELIPARLVVAVAALLQRRLLVGLWPPDKRVSRRTSKACNKASKYAVPKVIHNKH